MDWIPSYTFLAAACAFLLALCVGLGLFLWSVERHRDPHIHIKCEAPMAELVASVAGLTHGMVVGGNSVDILQDGGFFDAVMKEIEEAKKSVHFETFLWKEGKLGERLTKTLAAKAREGLTVRVLVDANGCK